ncbi:MAG: hypothetical protein HYY36_06255 [Gammaproteobacteria bacterium]|nr:hypothetical protein [Gammaproteobacteria bacterium]
MRNSKPYEESLKEALADPEEAAAYLNAALDDRDPGVFWRCGMWPAFTAAWGSSHASPEAISLRRAASGYRRTCS